MHIVFTEEQTLLRDSAEKFLRDNYSFDHRQAVVKSDEHFSGPMWQQFAELGWMMIPFPESVGGLEGNALELMLLGECFGQSLVLEPYVDTVLLAGGLLNQCDNSALKHDLITQIMSGELQLAFAYAEQGCAVPTSAPTSTVQTLCKRDQDTLLIEGYKTVVGNGAAAEHFLLLAKDADSQENVLVLVPADTAGITRRTYPCYDGSTACELDFENVQLPSENLLSFDQGLQAALQQVTAQALIFLCAEAVGAMDALVKATVDYTSQRKQFGQPIAKFQVLRHRMADMYMQTELTRSLLLSAAWHLEQGDSRAERLISALKAKITQAGRYVGQNAIQLHGGIGVTDELNVGHYFKRLTLIENTLGNRDFHLARMNGQAN